MVHVKSAIPLETLLFPKDMSKMLARESSESMSPLTEQSPDTSIFIAYDAISEPILIVSDSNYNIIHGNKAAISALKYKQIDSLPIYKVFPSLDVDLILSTSHIRSQCAVTKTATSLLYDLSIGSLMPPSGSKYWVITMHKTPTEAPNSRYHSEFEEIRQIGSGGYGKVYQSRNKIDGQEYAIKKVRINVNMSRLLEDSPTEDMLTHHQRLLREVKTFASLSNHPNVLRYYNAWIEPCSDHFSDDEDSDAEEISSSRKRKPTSPARKHVTAAASAIYIQMQLCMFSDLRQWIEKRGNFIPEQQCLEILWQVLSGLSHIHSQNVIHRDLKPENIFIDGDRVLLGDFGLAKNITEPMKQKHSSINLINSSTEEGTYLYMAPEILKSQKCTIKSDIYSFAMIFLEMFSLFSTGMERAKVLNHVKESGSPPETLYRSYPDEAILISQCLHSDPSMRPSAGQLLEEPVFLNIVMLASPLVQIVGSDPHSEGSAVPTLCRRSSVFSKDSGFTNLTIPKFSSLMTHHFQSNARKASDDSTLSPERNIRRMSSIYTFDIMRNPVYRTEMSKSYSELEFNSNMLLESKRLSKSTNMLLNPDDELEVTPDPRPMEEGSHDRILKLEKDVEELMQRLEASYMREKQLEEELEFVLENVVGSSSVAASPPKASFPEKDILRVMTTSGSSLASVSSPIPIPKRKENS